MKRILILLAASLALGACVPMAPFDTPEEPNTRLLGVDLRPLREGAVNPGAATTAPGFTGAILVAPQQPQSNDGTLRPMNRIGRCYIRAPHDVP